MNIANLFKIKDLMLILAFVLPLQATMGYFYTFFSNHFLSLEGANQGLLGVCYFISAVSEVPYLLFSDKLFKKIGSGKLLCISAVSLTIRWLLLGFVSDYRVAMFSQIFYGWGFIVMTVSMAKYINAVVPDALKSSGQMLISIGGYGIARTFGILGGGLLSDVMGGTRQGFILTAVIAGLALILFAPYYLRQPPLNGKNEA